MRGDIPRKALPEDLIVQLAHEVEDKICDYITKNPDYSLRDSTRAMVKVAEYILRNWG